MCKVLMFFRVFGIYLSSTVLVCFSLDRYFAVLHPLQVMTDRMRSHRAMDGFLIRKQFGTSVHPLISNRPPSFQVNDAHRRGKMMLILAWMVSFICSVPQMVIFSSLTHPDIEGFTQCVTFAFFSDNNPNEKKVIASAISFDARFCRKACTCCAVHRFLIHLLRRTSFDKGFLEPY